MRLSFSAQVLQADIVKAECATGYDAICGNRQNLRLAFSHVQDRFTYTQMKETAIDNAIVQIHRDAQPNIRAWYTRWGVDGSPANFIIRWFLYHLFRNRDARNDRKARSMDFHADDDEDDGKRSFRRCLMEVSLRFGSVIGSSAASTSTARSTSSGYYDPARNNYRG